MPLTYIVYIKYDSVYGEDFFITFNLNTSSIATYD
jgi:hypothetical protein